MDNNVIIDFSVFPAKAKCVKCGEEVEMLTQQKLSDTVKQIKAIEEKHKTCK